MTKKRSANIFLGKAREIYNTCYEQSLLLQLDDAFSTIDDLDLWNQNNIAVVPENARNTIKYILFVDKETEVFKIQTVINELIRLDVSPSEIYLSCQSSNPFDLSLIHI